MNYYDSLSIFFFLFRLYTIFMIRFILDKILYYESHFHNLYSSKERKTIMAKENPKKPLVGVTFGDVDLTGKKLNLELEKRTHSKSKLSISLGDEDEKVKKEKKKEKLNDNPKKISAVERRFTEKEYKDYQKEKIKTSASKAGKKIKKLLNDFIKA